MRWRYGYRHIVYAHTYTDKYVNILGGVLGGALSYHVLVAPILYVYIYFMRIYLFCTYKRLLYVYTHICIYIRLSAARWHMMCGLPWKAEGFRHRLEQCGWGCRGRSRRSTRSTVLS